MRLHSDFHKFLSFLAQATFPTKKLRQVSELDSNMFLEVTERHPEILQRILSTLLNVVMFEDCKNQWSMSRPLFVLILLYEDYFRYRHVNFLHAPNLVINDCAKILS